MTTIGAKSMTKPTMPSSARASTNELWTGMNEPVSGAFSIV